MRESKKTEGDSSTLEQALNSHHENNIHQQARSSRREASRNKSLANLKQKSGIHESGGNISGWS